MTPDDVFHVSGYLIKGIGADSDILCLTDMHAKRLLSSVELTKSLGQVNVTGLPPLG